MDALKGQVAVVTGASRGIGKAIALALGAEGSMTCLVGRDLAALQTVATEARAAAWAVTVHQADLASDRAILDLADRVSNEFGRLDILVHAAAALLVGRTDLASLADLDVLYRTNVRAPYALTQALLPSLRRWRGQVVFVNSSVGLAARAEVGQYASTKHALKAIADSLRDEVNEDGIRVLSVYPGRTATPGQAAIHQREGRPYRPARLLQPEDVASVVVNALTLPRTAEVTDVSIRPMLKP